MVNFSRRAKLNDTRLVHRRAPCSGGSACMENIGLETRRFPETGEQSRADQTGVRHRADWRREIPEQYQEFFQWPTIRFRHSRTANQDCGRTAWARQPAQLRRLRLGEIPDRRMAEGDRPRNWKTCEEDALLEQQNWPEAIPVT